jgi:Rieske Fe-S protein
MTIHSRRAVLIASLVSALSFRTASAGAAGPTLTPTKVGQTVIFRGKKYTAIKQGKKLVWDKGVAMTVAKTVALGKSVDLAIGETKAFKSGKTYFITRTATGLTAVDDICTHLGCAVELSGKELHCPCHGAAYLAADGKVINGPATRSLKSYIVKDVDGSIVITL